MFISGILSGRTNDTLKPNFWNQLLEAQFLNSYWLLTISKLTLKKTEKPHMISISTSIRPRKTFHHRFEHFNFRDVFKISE